MTKDELNILNIFESGNTHAVYTDTDSVITDTDSVIIDGHDRTPCMYDYASLILRVLDNV